MLRVFAGARCAGRLGVGRVDLLGLRAGRTALLSTKPSTAAQPNTGAIVEIKNAADFESLVMGASKDPPPKGGPVVVDFYADWCQPCKALTPKLEKLISAKGGSVRLAKLNVDNLAELAQALQVKSLPTVMLVHEGKLVDSFTGSVPDDQLAAFVDKAVGLAGGADVGKRSVEEAAALLHEGQLAEATALYSELLALPEHAASATAGLSLCALADDPPNLSLAQELVADLHKQFPQALNAPDVRRAIGKVALAAEGVGAEGGRSLDELRAEVDHQPLAHETRFELAQALLHSGDEAAACDELLRILKKDKTWNEGAAKALLLQIFDSLGGESEVVKKGRRRLANIVLM